jgi:predicted AlkP superfamily phosphohydrolase/phosphomutase
LADTYAVAERHTETLIYAIAQGDWDLAVIVYSIPDLMQHFFWQQMTRDEGPQRHAIRDGYIFIDQQLKRLMTYAGEQGRVLIMSDHGFGPICATSKHLAQWLAQQGFLCYLDAAQTSWRQQAMSRAYAWARRRLTEDLKAMLRRRLPGLRTQIESGVRFGGIDWTATTAYVGPSPCEIWINCQDREPQGIVAPGIDYEHVREALITALLDWHDPETGKQRVCAVYRREEAYRGRHTDLAPDVTIEWNPDAAPPPTYLDGNTSLFDADHEPEGVFLLAGPGIHRGVQIQGISLADLAPSVLHLLDVISPEPMDGRVLTELFESSGQTKSGVFSNLKKGNDGDENSRWVGTRPKPLR